MFINKKNQIFTLAHRGGCGLFPENTMPAFENAVNLGVDILELDIHLSRDKQIIISHDANFKRMGGKPLAIKNLDYPEIKNIDAGYKFKADSEYPYRGKGIHPPLLEALFETFSKIPMIIDMKPSNIELVPLFIGLIKKYRREENTIIASFHEEMLHAFMKTMPEMTYCSPRKHAMRNFMRSKLGLKQVDANFDVYALPYGAGRMNLLSKNVIQKFKNCNAKVFAWTVNKETDMKTLIDRNIDGIITDYPDRLLNILNH